MYEFKPVTAILVVAPPEIAKPLYPVTKLENVDEVETSNKYPSALAKETQFAVNPVAVSKVAAAETGKDKQVVADPFKGLSERYFIVPHEVFPLYG